LDWKAFDDGNRKSTNDRAQGPYIYGLLPEPVLSSRL